jgi:hypothetical protein
VTYLENIGEVVRDTLIEQAPAIGALTRDFAAMNYQSETLAEVMIGYAKFVAELPHGWHEINDAARKDMVWLLVDYHGEGGGDHALVDAQYGATIGFWQEGSGEGEDVGAWKLAGWCWTHDHFTEGSGKVIGWRPIGFDIDYQLTAPPIAREKPWVWWAGSFGDVECENIYELGELATRQEAIDAAVKGSLGSDDDGLFYVIEAQMGDADPAVRDDHPFAASRNKSLMRIVDGAAEPVA